MTGLYVIFAGMALFAGVVTVLDRLARREQHASSAPLFKDLASTRSRR